MAGLVEKGKLYTTRGVNDLVAENEQFAKFVLRSLKRFNKGDWGEMDAVDKQSNDHALKNGDLRILANYKHPTEDAWRIWIICEADRSITTVLFPDEY